LTIKRKLPFHYAWVILISCFIMTGFTLGTVINCRGVFVTPVCAGLGCSTSAFSLYVTLYGISSMITLIKVDKVFERFNINAVLTTALVGLSASSVIMGSATNLAHIYAAGILQGVSGAFLLFVPSPMLIKSWFNSRRGFALGIAGTSSGVVGAFMSPVLNEVIMRFGWRGGYFTQAAVILIFVAPITLWIIVKEPKDIGLTPYGESSAERVVSVSRFENSNYMSTGMILCIVYMAVVSITTCYAQFLSNHAVTIGFDSRIGALMISCAMIGNTGGKALFGTLSDKFGVKRIASLSAVITAVGLVIISVSTVPMLSCLGAIMFGSCYFNQIVVPPLFVADVVPKDAYNRAYPKVTMSQMITVALTPTIVSAIFDVTASYKPIFVFTLLFQVISIFLAFTISKIINDKKAAAQ